MLKPSASAGLRALALAAACAALSACAHGRAPKAVADPVIESPAEAPVEGRPALYAACVTDAAQAKAISRHGHYLRFTCTGAPAKALYAAAETFTRMRGREVVTGQRTTRHISTVLWDDQCWSDRDPTTGEATYGCYTDLPMKADFVDGEDAPLPLKGRKK